MENLTLRKRLMGFMAHEFIILSSQFNGSRIIGMMMDQCTIMRRLKVKIIAREFFTNLEKQLPKLRNYWHNCEFIFELGSNCYDWLVVIDDVSRKINGPVVKTILPRGAYFAGYQNRQALLNMENFLHHNSPMY